MKKTVLILTTLTILLFSCNNNKYTNSIEQFSEFMEDTKSININNYNKILIISETGCPPCNKKLITLNNKTLETSSNLILYCDRSGYYYDENSPNNCIFIAENLGKRLFDNTASLLIEKQDNSHKLTPIYPRNVDSIVNYFYK